MDTIGSHILDSRSPRRSAASAVGFGYSCYESGATKATITNYSNVRIVLCACDSYSATGLSTNEFGSLSSANPTKQYLTPM
ncbi:MAG: hypothetical protein MUE60_12820, partial [Candidatus Eisenbacteria bacterium]|nr:hypothetical protein [Candidatus Eisenbacteria bacterium]